MKKDVKETKKMSTPQEDVVRVLLQKTMEKDIDAKPYVAEEKQEDIEEITKKLKKEYAERRR